MSDPAGQYEWLQDTLELSKQNMEKVQTIQYILNTAFIKMNFALSGLILVPDNYLATTCVLDIHIILCKYFFCGNTNMHAFKMLISFCVHRSM